MFTTYMFVVHVRWKKNMALFEYALILMNMYLYYYQRTNVREVLHLVLDFYGHMCEWCTIVDEWRILFRTDTTFESGQKESGPGSNMVLDFRGTLSLVYIY